MTREQFPNSIQSLIRHAAQDLVRLEEYQISSQNHFSETISRRMEGAAAKSMQMLVDAVSNHNTGNTNSRMALEDVETAVIYEAAVQREGLRK